jgi:hypothetical protein
MVFPEHTQKNRTGRLASAVAFGMEPHGGQIRMVARKSGWIAAWVGALFAGGG